MDLKHNPTIYCLQSTYYKYNKIGNLKTIKQILIKNKGTSDISLEQRKLLDTERETLYNDKRVNHQIYIIILNVNAPNN